MNINNFDLLFLDITAGAAFLPNDRTYNGRKIKTLILFTREDLASNIFNYPIISDSEAHGVYIDIFTNADVLISQRAQIMQYALPVCDRPEINAVLDMDKTKIYTAAPFASEKYICLGVVYDDYESMLSYQGNLRDNVKITISGGDVFKLDFAFKNFERKKIKRLLIRPTDGFKDLYLTLKTKSNRNLDDLPAPLFSDELNFNVWLDIPDLDAERSIIRNTSRRQVYFNIIVEYDEQ